VRQGELGRAGATHSLIEQSRAARLRLPPIRFRFRAIAGVGQQAALSVERDDDLAVGAALVDVRQRLEGLVERERRVDERAEVARVVE
jgi:hypothetical protein